MDLDPAERCFDATDVLMGILRFLGPLDWLKCSAVCSPWSIAILGEHASVSPPAKSSINLWREFAVTVMLHEPHDNFNLGPTGAEDGTEAGNTAAEEGNSLEERGDAGNGKSSSIQHHSHGDGGPSASRRGGGVVVGARDGIVGCSKKSRGRGAHSCYKYICLEGDPSKLGPPLRPVPDACGEVKLSVRDIEAAAVARWRKPRSLVKLLRVYMSHGNFSKGEPRLISSSLTHKLSFTFPPQGARRATATRVPPSSLLPATCRRQKSRSKSGALLKLTTSVVNDALRAFTGVLVLCRRCRCPRTALYASSDRPSASHGARVSLIVPEASRAHVGDEVSLWIECHGSDCGMTHEVPTAGGPRWLTKFASYVLHHDWEDVNLLPADQGTTWFSDTSPEAVQRRRHEAQANSHGLDALASVYASGMGDG